MMQCPLGHKFELFLLCENPVVYQRQLFFHRDLEFYFPSREKVCFAGDAL